MLTNSQPSSSLNNKTGSWRTFKPEVDANLCVGCLLCAKLCPDNCIVMQEKKEFANKKKAEINYDYCKGCGLCAKECPVKAIKMIKDY